MFELSGAQKQAAMDAMNGTSPTVFAHLILYLIGTFAVVWFLLMIIGIWQSLHEQKLDMGDALGRLAMAIFVLICAGALIVY